MLHIHYFITRKPGIDEAEFHRYWREVHGPIAARIPQLRRYVQSHRVPAPRATQPTMESPRCLSMGWTR
jgi:uncharacterized protein (TIGR02118 family)